MKLYQAFQFKLKTNKEQEEKFKTYAGICRFVWNKALSLIKNRLVKYSTYKIVNAHALTHYSQPPLIPHYEDIANLLPLWKHSEEYGFLLEAPSQVLQQTLKDLCKAISSAFTKANGIRFPQYRKKGKSPDSIRYPQGFKIKGNRIFLPKIGWVRFFKSREIKGKPKNVTVKKYPDGWYISIVTEVEVEKPKENLYYPVGIDVGVAKAITLSNGYYFAPLDLTRYEKKLTKLQHQLSKKQHPRHKGDKTPISNNFIKQKKRIEKLHQKIANIRKDFLHKVSTAIAKNHGLIAVENLSVKNMTKSAKGTMEDPGRNVKQKSMLNKSILSQGWSMFFYFLEYKLQRQGGRLIKVNPRYTSQTCPVCGHVSKDNRKSQAVFVCEKCGYTANADLVASINILMKAIGKENLLQTLPQGLWKVTPVEYAKHTLKQEPVGSREALPLPEAV